MSAAHTGVTHERRLVEAAAWRLHLTEQGAETSDDFEVWLVDPQNAAAWQQVQKSWSFFGEHAASPELLALRQRALAHARREGGDRWVHTKRRKGILRFIAAASVAAITIALLSFWMITQPEVYRTAAGERRVLTLSDGSQVALDAQSEVRVAYSDGARALMLVRGQARFDVAKNPARPFTVEAAGSKVVATGTAFNVDLLGAELRVTLIEGRVLVMPSEAHGPEETDARDAQLSQTVARSESKALRAIELMPGEQLLASELAPIKVAVVDLDRAIAWQQGRLVFEDETLSSVALRMSRYSERALNINDPKVAAMRISGVFKTSDMEGFIATITSYLPVDARARADGSIELALR